MARLAPGIYERLVTHKLEKELRLLEPELLRRARLDPADAHEVLARHVAALARRALRAAADAADQRERLAQEIALAQSDRRRNRRAEPGGGSNRSGGDRD
jgi:hypothetical protein